MKLKSLILMATVAFGFTLSAAELTVVSTEKLEVESVAYHPTLSPNGNIVLFSSENHRGLNALNLATNSVQVLDENAAAGFDPIFTANGTEVVYRTLSYQDGLARRDVKRCNVNTGEKVQLVKPERGTLNTRAMVLETYAYGCPDKQAIEVTIAGQKKEINPIGDGYRYLWPAISPAKQKLLFNEVYSGLYVSELDGSKAKHLAFRADFPCWAGDEYVVAVSSKDDGYVITSAKVIAIEVATGKVTELTDDSIIVSGVTATNDKIIYTTEDGQMYVMNIKISK